MANDHPGAQPPSERAARLYFELVSESGDPRVLDLLHPDVVLLLRKLGGRRTLRGKEEVARFLEELPERFPVYQAIAEEFRVVDDDRVVVEGRMRWMDDDRVLRDDSMIWALEFRDGLLYRSSPARSLSEAHAILVAGGRPAEEGAENGGR